MEVIHIGKHILIHGDHVDATFQMVCSGKYKTDLIVADPNYRNIGKDIKDGQYEHLYHLAKPNSLLLHFTYNANGQRNCEEAADYVLIPFLIKNGFKFRSKVIWSKYRNVILQMLKRSWRRSATPNDTDFLIITVKDSKQFPKHLDLNKLCKGSSIIYHDANQKDQFKPLNLVRDVIAALTVEGDTILDTHMGSANLGVEAIKANRLYIGIESDKKLFDEAVIKLKALNNI